MKKSIVVNPASPMRLLTAWLSIGLQSFGGGAATLALIRQTFVVQHQWLTESEFTEDWALCQIAPGINLLGFAIMIGRRLARGWGIFVSLVGLLLPSVLATLLLTAFYARFAHVHLIESALRGVIPAVVGISLVTAFGMARPLMTKARTEGAGALVVAGLILGGSTVALIVHTPVAVILLGGGSIGGLYEGWRKARVRVS